MFAGEGAFLAGGRWNPPGLRVVYSSATASLAALESLVHASSEALLDASVGWCVARLAWPAALPTEVLSVADCAALSSDWNSSGGPALDRPELQEFGAHWVAEGKTAILAVPSAVLPAEFNYLFNTAHPDWTRTLRGLPEAFVFDARLVKKCPSRR